MHKHTSKAIAITKSNRVNWLLISAMFIALAAFTSLSALANTAVERHIENAKIVGEERFTYLFWDIYDAKLYAPNATFDKAKPFALSLHYLHALDGEKIADKSANSIRELGFTDEVRLAAWHSEMLNIFPDVDKGSVITGVYEPNKPTHFYLGSEEIGMVRDPEFGKWFFDIWLSEKTEEPEFRAKLLGL